MSTVLGAFIVMCSGVQSFVLAGDVFVAEATADASVAQGQPITNFGSENVLVVGEAGGEWRGFIRWDFVGASMVPQGSTITSVAIQLNRQCTSATSGIFLELGTVNEDWSEGTLRWGTRPMDVDSLALYPLATCTGGPEWIELVDTSGELRNRIQLLVDSGTSGYGVELKSSPPVGDAYQLIRSREDTPPRLVITYEDVEPGTPDLAVVSVDSDPGPIGLCEPTFDAEVTVQNIGTAASLGGAVRFKVTTSPNCGSGQQIYQATLEDIEPGETKTLSYAVTIPPGLNRQDYYIFADISLAEDVNDDNNCGHSDGPVEFEHCADLAVSSVQTQASNYAPGDKIVVDFSLENTGGILSEPVVYSVYLSTDTIVGSDTQVWGPFSLGSGIQPYATTSQSKAIELADTVSPGSYFIGVAVEDNGGFEDQAFSSIVSIGSTCAADLVMDGTLDGFDVFEFIALFNAQDQLADFIDDDIWDGFDVFEFITQFNTGCP